MTWSFEAGPRQTVSLDGTFGNVEKLADAHALNWTPVRDENDDFELNTRGVSGGRGFITTDTDLNADGITPDSDPNVRNFGPASGNRSAQQTDLKNWIAFAVRSAIAPPPQGGNPARGRDVFASGPPAGANCVACHSGEKWTTSRVTYDPVDVNPIPGVDTGIVNTPDPGSVFLNGFVSAAGAGRLCEVPPPPGASNRLRIMHQIGTFTAVNPIEVRHGALSPVNTVTPAAGGRKRVRGGRLQHPDAARHLRQRALFPPRRGPDPRGGLRHRDRSELPVGRPRALALRDWRRAKRPRQQPDRGQGSDRVPAHDRRPHRAVPGRRPRAKRPGVPGRGSALRLPEGSAARNACARLQPVIGQG